MNQSNSSNDKIYQQYGMEDPNIKVGELLQGGHVSRAMCCGFSFWFWSYDAVWKFRLARVVSLPLVLVGPAHLLPQRPTHVSDSSLAHSRPPISLFPSFSSSSYCWYSSNFPLLLLPFTFADKYSDLLIIISI